MASESARGDSVSVVGDDEREEKGDIDPAEGVDETVIDDELPIITISPSKPVKKGAKGKEVERERDHHAVIERARSVAASDNFSPEPERFPCTPVSLFAAWNILTDACGYDASE